MTVKKKIVSMDRDSAAVIRVGDGRGFVVEVAHRSPHYAAKGLKERAIITAAHCLPKLPPAHRAAGIEELTYGKLVGPLGKKPSVAVECYFVDPVADIAVLGSPDGQELFEEAEAFTELVDGVMPLPIADGRPPGTVRLLALGGEWFECELNSRVAGICIVNGTDIEAGMSGSPIMQRGSAVGVVSLSTGPQAHLMRDLPGRMLRRNARRSAAGSILSHDRRGSLHREAGSGEISPA